MTNATIKWSEYKLFNTNPLSMLTTFAIIAQELYISIDTFAYYVFIFVVF